MTRQEIIDLSNSYKTGPEREILKQHFSLDRKVMQDEINHACEIISPQRHTILFSAPSETGTSYFRIFEPMLAMYRFHDEFNLCYTENLKPWHYGVADLIIAHRAGDLHDIAHDVINRWPLHKVKPVIIHNVDDNEISLSKKHPMYDMWIASGRDKQSLRSIRESNGVEITTHKLKQFMQNHNKGTWITRNQFNWRLPQWNLEKKMPLSNFVKDTGVHDFPVEWKDKIVIGWSGLTSHYEDLVKMAPIIKRIHDKYPNTVFILAGMALKDTSYKLTQDAKTGETKMEEDHNVPEEQKYRTRVTKLFKDIDPDRIKIYDALPLEEYGWFASLFDIGIAYIEHNPFNSAKSEIKILEYLKYGAVPVFSNFGGYADFIDMVKKGNILSDPNIIDKMACRTEFDVNEWADNIGYWIERIGTEEYNKPVKELQAFVTKQYDIDYNVTERISKYKRMIEDNIEREQNRILTSGFQPSYKTV